MFRILDNLSENWDRYDVINLGYKITYNVVIRIVPSVNGGLTHTHTHTHTHKYTASWWPR